MFYSFKQLKIFFLLILSGLLIVVGINLLTVYMFSSENYDIGLTIEAYSGPVLFGSTRDKAISTIVNHLYDADDTRLLQILNTLQTSSSESLYRGIFSYDHQKKLFIHYDQANRIKAFKILFNLIDEDDALVLTTTAIDLYRIQDDVTYTFEGVNYNNNYYGTTTLTLRSSLPIYYTINGGSTLEYEEALTLKPGLKKINYQTRNKYDQLSVIHSLKLPDKEFSDLLQLTSPSNRTHIHYDFSPSIESPLIPMDDVAVFFHDNVYYLANQAYQWSYFSEEEDQPTLQYLFMDQVGLIELDSLDKTLQEVYIDRFETMIEDRHHTELFFLEDISGNVPSEFPGLYDVRTWGDYKSIMQAKVDLLIDQNYMYHNLVAGYIKEAPDIFYVKLYDRSTDFKEGIRIVFGDNYANVYRFKEGTLSSSHPNLVHEHYDEIPLYSANLNENPYAYRDRIVDIASTFEDNNKTPENLASDVGDYIIDLISYDRKNILQYDSHTPFKAIDNGLGVCESYATLANDLLNYLGVETYYIHADDENRDNDTHAYNLVKVGDTYKFYDFTWADKDTYIDRRYYGFDLGFHPYEPYISNIILNAFDIDG